jgi:hypothetical protein
MSSMMNIVVKDARTAASVKAWLRTVAGLRPESIQRVASMISDYAGGVHAGRLTLSTTAVAASATATFSTVVAGNYVVIGGVTFTGSDSPSTGVQFLTGTTDILSAVSLAAKVNANTTANKLVIATSSGAVVTFTSIVPGPVGNFITLTKNGSPITVTGSGFLAGGTSDVPVVIYNGI